ncbi:MAG: hypothetical protein CVV64_12465 [Candidatus Wallbacteria bacterium HGW-Wallbacteria-1]|uniref:NADH-quinone oxidoreductase subunit F n=1 Tax=Candidatus Wallbacteria bacterium HGW-Wallbacteria-1 TaxID=2013854 RepID=A0A2N1PNE5_9BACT|nr:MAG: hypothetical protein CVV64_12465 [Candidatus Wallbacteria bacterium HGW-Wallbacteria-1]
MKIEICMGSSCFARGNEKNLQVIEEFIDSQAISCTVDLVGKRCENLCCDGPNIRINGVRFQGVDRGMILDILEKSVRNS